MSQLVARVSLGEYNCKRYFMKNKPQKSSIRNSKNEEPATPEKKSFKKQVLVPLFILICLVIGTVFAVLYGRGYRLFVNEGSPQVSKTGILHITSIPNSAQVYINGHPTAVTSNSINLNPAKYTVRVSKDGYNDWQKDVEIHTEEVIALDARLHPKSPTLQSISTFGVEEAIVDPTGTKLAFRIASQSAARKNGIYIFDMTARTLPILQGQSASNQIADDTIDKFSEATLTWSPDSRELLASISAAVASDATTVEPTPTEDVEAEVPSVVGTLSTYYLLQTDNLNETPQDVTATITEIEALWLNQRQEKERARLKSLKPKVAKFSSDYFRILSWSPDDTKILYQASESANMPIFVNPRRIGNNNLYERRDLKKGAIYVYDIAEDVNTRIVDSIDEICLQTDPDCTTQELLIQNAFTWFPDSEHLIYVNDKKIHIVEDDGANMTTIFAGPFLGHYVFPWPDGSKIVILTNLGNPTVSPTLYTIGLK